MLLKFIAALIWITTLSLYPLTTHAIPDLVAHYSFNTGSGTQSGDGTLLNGAGWGDGNFGKALQLSGAGQYVSVSNPAGSVLDPQFITISAWINPTLVGDEHHYVVSKHRDCCDVPGQGGYGLRINRTTGTLRGGLRLGSEAGAHVPAYGALAEQGQRDRDSAGL